MCHSQTRAEPAAMSRSAGGRMRTAALCGLASFALIMISAFVLARPLWNAPATGAPPGAIAAYVHQAHGREVSSLLVYAVGIGLFLCFAAGLWRWLSAIESAPATMSGVFAFGTLALAVLILVAFAVAEVMIYRPVSPAIAQTLRDLTFGLLALSGIPSAVCMGAYASLVLRHGALARWTGWLALMGVLAHLLISVSFLDHGGLLSLEGPLIVLVPGTFFAWIFAASLALLGASRPRER